MLKITIETEYPTELRELINALQNTNTGCRHHAEPITVSAPALIETARKLDKAIDDAKPAPFQTGTITAPTTVNPTVGNLSTDATPQKKQRAGNLATYKTSTPVSTPASSEPQTSVNVPSVPIDRNWSVDETSLLRTCQTVDDARFVYRSHFGDARNDSAIAQKWHKMNKAGQLLKAGDKVRCIDGSYDGKISTITGFTDDHQSANVKFPNDAAMYQFSVYNLERAE